MANSTNQQTKSTSTALGESQLGQALGTGGKGSYDPGTGTYTSPTGEKQSMPSAPSGATITGANPLQRTYTGGGGGTTTYSPSLPQSSPTLAAAGPTMEELAAQTRLLNEQARQKEIQRQQEIAREQQIETQKEVARQQVGQEAQKVYYTSNESWKPKDKNAVVIYTKESGELTGKTSLGYIENLKGARPEGENAQKINQYVRSQSKYQEFKKNLSNFQNENPNEKIIFDRSGNPVGVQSSYLGKSMPFDSYIRETERINNLLPKTEKFYFNPYVGLTKNAPTSSEVKEGVLKTQFSVYIDPSTGKPIENIANYLRQKNIPLAANENFMETLKQKSQPRTPEEWQNLLKSKAQVFDVSSVRNAGTTEKFTKTTGGTVSPLLITKGPGSTESALDIAMLLTGGKLIKGVIKGTMSASTATAVALNSHNFAKLADPSTTNKTKLASLKEIAISLGTSAIGGTTFGATSKFTEKAAEAAGYKILYSVLRNSGSRGSSIIRNIAGLSLIGAGKTAKFGIETYFKYGMIKAGTEAAQALEQQDYRKFSLSASNLAGGLIGYRIGERIGPKAFSLSSFVAGTSIPSRSELYKGEVAVKRMPSSIQADILTGKDNIIFYRRGPVETGLITRPRLDKYLREIKTPTKQVFVRYAETRGVKGNKISPDISVPSFVQPPTYKEMFLNNLRNAKGNKLSKLIDAIAKTPVMTDVLTVGRYKIKAIDPILRDKVLKELATTGELSKSSQAELLKTNSLISDKVREWKFAEEQEAAIRNTLKLSKNNRLGFTSDQNGKLIPVIYEAGTLKPRLDTLRNKDVITQQDAKFIQRQYDMWKKYKDEYIQPKEHSIGHAKRVMENVEKIIRAYPEFHNELKNRYGSLNNAIKEIQRGALYHDIGKTSETSREFGTPHGQKFYNVFSAGLLPKEIQSVKRPVAKAIRTHETLAGTEKGTLSLRYKIENLFGKYSIEQKILSTADRLDLSRYGMKIDPNRLPIKDVISRLNIKVKEYKNVNLPQPRNLLINERQQTKEKKYVQPVRLNSMLTGQPYSRPKQGKQVSSYQQYKKPKSINSYMSPVYQKSRPSYNAPKYKKQGYSKPSGYRSINTYLTPKYPQPQKYGSPVPYTKYGPKPRPYYTSRPERDINLRIINRPSEERKAKVKPVRRISRKVGYATLPTVFEQLTFGGRKGKAPRTSIRGFEVFRFR